MAIKAALSLDKTSISSYAEDNGGVLRESFCEAIVLDYRRIQFMTTPEWDLLMNELKAEKKD